jgi:peptidoglycan/xylan/chitin deacetylase (PgdA/CDA1 family)
MAPAWARGFRRLVTSARTARWLARRRPEAGKGVRVLLYHRISDDRDPLAVPVARFAAQVAFLAEQGYAVVPVSGAVAALAAAGESRVIGLSFDDGYRDVVENALPLLRRHGFRASMFVASGLVDGSARATWYVREPPPLLGWDEIEALDAAGDLELEAHSVTHRDLVRLSDAEARAEIEASKRELELRLGRPIAGFSYPAGSYGEREQRLVEETGYDFAVTCDPGPNGASANRFAVRRIEVLGADGVSDFRARLAGAHDAPMPFRGLYRRLRR